MKETQTPIPWQEAKRKIEEHTTSQWKQKWINSPHYELTNFYEAPNKKNLNTY